MNSTSATERPMTCRIPKAPSPQEQRTKVGVAVEGKYDLGKRIPRSLHAQGKRRESGVYEVTINGVFGYHKP